jgi:uncharacterized protein (TIGR03083 family)
MARLPAELYYAEIDAATASLAALVDYADPDLSIPTCPGWTLLRLAEHVGEVQRRATMLVATRSAGPADLGSIPDSQLPADPNSRGRWLTAGAAALIEALRGADGAEVWAFGSVQPADAWARRVSHDTMVHAADGALAAGDEVALPAELAADAIDEWLTVLSGPLFGRPDPRMAALPPGTSLHVHATDPELSGSGEWLVKHMEDGVKVTASHAKADVAIGGPAADILLVLLGRRVPADPPVIIFGDRALLDTWLTEISF